MAAPLLRIGRLSCVKCLQAESWISLSRAPAAAAFSSKSGGSKKIPKKFGSDKNQAKTYFDIEKLVQHKPYEFQKKEVSPAAAAAAAAKAPPATETPTSAAPEVEASTSGKETTPTTDAVAELAVAAEAAPVAEVPPTAEAAPVIGATPEVVLESVPVGVSGPVVEASAAEPAPPVKAAPIAEASATETRPAVDAVPEPAPPLEVAPEPVVQAVAVEAAPEAATPEPVAEAVPVETVPEPVAEAVPVETIPEPVAEAVPVEVTESAAPDPVTEATAGVSAVDESSEQLVDLAPVIAEAAGEELQTEVPAEAVEPSEVQMDPIQKLFLDSIRQYSAQSQAVGGLVDAGSEYEKALAEEIAKLQRLYGGGDLSSFPEFKFPEPRLDEVSPK